ncbi:MAG: Acg family FMN-binding oxidoreductase [Actinomycetes bacterium]
MSTKLPDAARTLTDDEVRAVVATAVQAPSVHNTQPWRFRVRSGALQLRADRSRHLTATDPDGRELLLSCGAALLGARLAMQHRGHAPAVRRLPDPADPDLLAELHVGRPAPADPEVEQLVAAMGRRRSFRGRFDHRSVEPSLVFLLQQAAEREGARLIVVQRPGAKRAVADLVAAAERAQQSHPGVRAELERWTPPPGSDRRDGVPATAYPARTPAPGPLELPRRDFAAGRDQDTAPDPTLIHVGAPGPVIAVLVTAADSPSDWLLAGSALYRVLLTAAAHGVVASLHGQPTELGGLRRLLADELLSGEHPQMVLQLGRTTSTAPPTPRRPVSEVLDD